MITGIYNRFIKRALDFLLLIPAFAIGLPVMMVIGVVSTAYFGKKIIFKQKRIGYNEDPFNILKFRTLDQSDEAIELAESKLTGWGSFLRQYSLDELPQLFNILKGEMSFVGPRPLLEPYLSYYTSIEKKRHLVRPGLTGLAQVNGRNLLDWDKRLVLDVEYVHKVSFWLDVNILFKTFGKVFQKETQHHSKSLIESRKNQ